MILITYIILIEPFNSHSPSHSPSHSHEYREVVLLKVDVSRCDTVLYVVMVNADLRKELLMTAFVPGI